MYGLSETCGGVTVTGGNLEDFENVGTPFPMTKVKVSVRLCVFTLVRQRVRTFKRHWLLLH